MGTEEQTKNLFEEAEAQEEFESQAEAEEAVEEEAQEESPPEEVKEAKPKETILSPQFQEIREKIAPLLKDRDDLLDQKRRLEEYGQQKASLEGEMMRLQQEITEDVCSAGKPSASKVKAYQKIKGELESMEVWHQKLTDEVHPEKLAEAQANLTKAIYQECRNLVPECEKEIKEKILAAIEIQESFRAEYMELFKALKIDPRDLNLGEVEPPFCHDLEGTIKRKLRPLLRLGSYPH